jgi:CRP-like cAMP-binding protein
MLIENQIPSGKPNNCILASLGPTQWQRLQPHLSFVELPLGATLQQPNTAIQSLYFLERGMASVTHADRTGTVVEVGIIGREGVIGAQALLGGGTTETRTVMQGGGEGYRVRVSAFREAMGDDALAPIYPFLRSYMERTMQLVLCNRLHSVESRLARWLLTASDVMESSTLSLTQEFLAQMLGSSRPGVTVAAGVLQRSGSIVYNRGNLHILQRELLQNAACECYPAIRKLFAEARSEESR